MTLHSLLPLAAEIGPDTPDTCVCGHADEDHAYDVDPVCLLCDCPRYDDAHLDIGSGTVALFLAAVLLLGLVLLAVVGGRAVLCDVHADALRYCPGYGVAQ